MAATVLAGGGLVAFPTETVYGLGADASNAAAVTRIFEVKGRPAGHPLIVHLGAMGDLDEWSRLDEAMGLMVQRLGQAFWPGPLTVVVPRSNKAASECVGGRATIGLRIPDHPLALGLLERFGGGLAGPSANLFGRVSPTTAAHVLDDLDGLVDVIVDGGPTAVGIESTIVEIVGSAPTLLRPGAVTRRELEEVLQHRVIDGTLGESRASGMLRSHYAPRATIEIREAEDLVAELGSTASTLTSDVGIVAPVAVDHQPSWLLPAEAGGYAARFYETLREADRLDVGHLIICPPVHGPMLAAVGDRLAKAAAPRA